MAPGFGAESARPFSPLVEHAIELSAQWHDGTYRKGAWRDAAFPEAEGRPPRVPVMAHVTAVGLTLCRSGWDDATVAAGFLHDVLEDENAVGERLSFDRLALALGEPVAILVQWVTEQKLDQSGAFRPWRVRKEDYLARLQEAPVEAVAISVADKLHNLWSMNQTEASGIDLYAFGAGRQGLSAGWEEQQWFYESVYALAVRRGHPGIAPILDRLETEIDRFVDAQGARGGRS